MNPPYLRLTHANIHYYRAAGHVYKSLSASLSTNDIFTHNKLDL